MVVGGNKDHMRPVLQRFHEIESGPAGHLYVKEDEVDLRCIQDPPGLRNVPGLTHDANIRMLVEKPSKVYPGEAFIVHYEYSDLAFLFFLHGCFNLKFNALPPPGKPLPATPTEAERKA